MCPWVRFERPNSVKKLHNMIKGDIGRGKERRRVVQNRPETWPRNSNPKVSHIIMSPKSFLSARHEETVCIGKCNQSASTHEQVLLHNAAVLEWQLPKGDGALVVCLVLCLDISVKVSTISTG